MAYESLDPVIWPTLDWSRIDTRFKTLQDSLVICVPMPFDCGPPFDYINGITGTYVGTASTAGDYQGGTMSALGSGNYVSFGNTSFLAGYTYNFTMTMAVMHQPIATTQACLVTYADSNSDSCPGGLIYSFGTAKQYAFWNDNQGVGPTSGALLYDVGTRNFVVGRRNLAQQASPTCDLFVNGVNVGTTTSTAATVNVTGSSPILAVNRFGGYNGYMGSGLYGLLYIWQRYLTDSEVGILSEDPYGIFRPIPRTFVFIFPTISVPTTTTALAPDSIAASTNLTTTLANIQDDPDSPDSSWLTATDATAATDIRVTFPTPAADPYGQQDFKLWLRKTTGTPTPTVDVSLYENGSSVALLANDTPITSTSGQLLTLNWSSSSLGTANGSVVECRAVSTAGLAADVAGAMPAYDGTGQATQVSSATITTTISPAKPSTVNAGDLLILQVLARNQDASPNQGAGPTSVTGFTPFPGNTYGSSTNANYAHHALYWRIAGAGEAGGTVDVTCSGGTTTDLAMARIYRFTAADGFADPPIEGITTNSGTASPMAAPVTGDTPSGLNRLAVCFGAIASSDIDIGSMTGETAGNWTEAVGGVGGATLTGGDGTLNVQTADASAGTAISGGSVAFTLTTSAHWTTVACYLVPTSTPGAATNTVEIGAIEWNATYQTPESQGIVHGIFGDRFGVFGGAVIRS